MGKKRRKENCKMEGGKFQMKGDKVRKLVFFETTEICLGSTKMKISTGKKHFIQGKIVKSDFAPPPNPL